ncbi:hypothetical protein DYB30_003887 [Aphanomyces astaci]|uniref:Uncharacterized protein n=1 Tax=Aphanomyces astaci TaxID=112090 RepID=A0A397CXC7_APHAT|nr:hypothetical protein DYB30_003887 [Aphanomyces astaci]
MTNENVADTRLMATYKKSKFFYELDKIYAVPKPSGECAVDPFDEMLANTPHFASIHAFVDESQREEEDLVEQIGIEEPHPSDAPEFSSPQTQTLLLPVTQTQIVADIVPETILDRTSSALVDGKSTSNDKVASDMMEIVPETKPSEGEAALALPHSIPVAISPTTVLEPHPSPPSAHNDDTSTSLDESSIVPSISFHVDDSRDFVGDASSLYVNDSLAAFPPLPPTPSDDPPTPPTQQAVTTTTFLRPRSRTIPVASAADYYDTDHMAEIIPCWLLGPRCQLHDPHLPHPQLLFYIQALDMFLHASSTPSSSYLRTAVVVARRVFVELWHRHVLTKSPSDSVVNFDLEHYLTRGNTLPGVCTPVWRYLEAIWHVHEGRVLHTTSFYARPASDTHQQSPPESLRPTIEALRAMQFYGNRHPCASLKALVPHYMHQATDSRLQYRHVVAANDMHLALRGLQAKLKCPVIPMGAFRRGGVFLSVLDVLAIITSSVTSIVSLLQQVKVLECDTVHVTSSRIVAPIRFKTHHMLVDLKVYAQPAASFAMLYFTGPASYVASTLLAPMLMEEEGRVESREVTFDLWYTWLLRKHGADVLHTTVTDEASACRVLQIPYNPPKDRLV